MKRLTYFAEDLETGQRHSAISKSAAKAWAKNESTRKGHAVAVVAVDYGTAHPQGAYYGRTWREGGYTYTPKRSAPLTIARTRVAKAAKRGKVKRARRHRAKGRLRAKGRHARSISSR